MNINKILYAIIKEGNEMSCIGAFNDCKDECRYTCKSVLRCEAVVELLKDVKTFRLSKPMSFVNEIDSFDQIDFGDLK